jgi:hypothetical protein
MVLTTTRHLNPPFFAAQHRLSEESADAPLKGPEAPRGANAEGLNHTALTLLLLSFALRLSEWPVNYCRWVSMRVAQQTFNPIAQRQNLITAR